MLRRTLMVVSLMATANAFAADVLSVLPAAELDPAVPSVTAVTGAGWAEQITSAADVTDYVRRLAAAAPDRVRTVEYARSLEGRPLIAMIITSPERMKALEATREGLQRLGDPRGVSDVDRTRLKGSLPAVVWIACSVHGDEASGADAGLALAYYLAAARSPAVDGILQHTVVVIDPMENPDGRARFVASTRAARGIEPDPDPASAEHVQPWPGGRYSHDLFDLNRDWFALTSPETAGRVALMQQWPPVVAADLHEMGAEMHYYFAPPAEPVNPLVSKTQAALWEVLGRANARAFDAEGWKYWTREEFDAFYPGYGESWPLYSGGVGMTFEAASSRGLVTRLEDGTLLRYADDVERHLLAAFSTVRAVADDPVRFLQSWAEYRAAAVASGAGGWRLGPGGGAPALADLLARHGIEVYAAADGYLVPQGQPMGRMAEMLLRRDVPMPASFTLEQERRWAKRLPDGFYDATAWSLPLLWGVDVHEVDRLSGLAGASRVVPGALPEGRVEGNGGVAYLLPWDSPAAAAAMVRLLRMKVGVEVSERAFTLGGQRYGRGTLVIRSHGRSELRSQLEEVAKATGVTFRGTESGFAEEGIDLGSVHVRRVEAPRVALLWDRPASPSGAGAERFTLERFLGYPVTVVRSGTLGRADISQFDVIIIPDSWGGWGGALGEDAARRLGAWVHEGGVVVGVGGGAAWLTGDKVGLLSSHLKKLDTGSGQGASAPPKAGAAAGQSEPAPPGAPPDDELPPQVPGAIVRVDLDGDSPFSAGFPEGAVDALVSSNRVFAPLPLDKGTNVGSYASEDRLVESGYMLPASRHELPGAAYMMVEPRGRGKVIAFAEDPATRGYTRATMMLLINAVFFGAAF